MEQRGRVGGKGEEKEERGGERRKRRIEKDEEREGGMWTGSMSDGVCNEVHVRKYIPGL